MLSASCTRRSITQACLRPLGCIGGFCRAIKVQLPKTNGQDPKKIKGRMKSSRFHVLYISQTEGVFSSATSHRHESLLESHKWPTNLWNHCENSFSTVQKNDEIIAESVSWSRRETVRGWTGCMIHFRTRNRNTVRAHPLTGVPYSFLRSFHSFVQRWWCWANKWSCVAGQVGELTNNSYVFYICTVGGRSTISYMVGPMAVINFWYFLFLLARNIGWLYRKSLTFGLGD